MWEASAVTETTPVTCAGSAGPPGLDRVDTGAVEGRDVDAEVKRARRLVADEVLPRVVEVAPDRVRTLERPKWPRVRRHGGALCGGRGGGEPDGGGEDGERDPRHRSSSIADASVSYASGP